MKIQFLSINIILIILNISCINQKKNENYRNISTLIVKKQKIEKIQLVEQTRGINEKVIFTPTSITAISNGETTESPISSSDWGKISKQAGAIDLSNISNLQSPTTGRFSDQALSATITIVSEGSAFTSASFDAGKPPKELGALYGVIKDPSGKLKRKP